MTPLFRASVAIAFCACVAGCAVSGTAPLTAISAENAGNAIIVGKSTKADVLAVLGKTTVVSFDSGFEVWVYEVTGGALGLGGLFGRAGSEGGASGRSEFVILFAPSGVVTKARMRPPPPHEARRS